jgi:hypothetical protein
LSMAESLAQMLRVRFEAADFEATPCKYPDNVLSYSPLH